MMKWKEHLKIGTKDTIIMFCIIFVPFMFSMAILYYFYGAENPRQWDVIAGIYGICSFFAFVALFIGFVYKPINILKNL